MKSLAVAKPVEAFSFLRKKILLAFCLLFCQKIFMGKKDEESQRRSSNFGMSQAELEEVYREDLDDLMSKIKKLKAENKTLKATILNLEMRIDCLNRWNGEK